MTRYWLAGAAAFAMMTGAAFAQGMSSQSSTTTQSTTMAPAVGSYSSSETKHSTDGNGTATDKSATYHSGVGGSNSSSNSTTTSSDGSMQSTSHEKQINSTDGGSSISKKSTTTTIDR